MSLFNKEYYAEECHSDMIGRYAISDCGYRKVVGAFETHKGVQLVLVSKDGILNVESEDSCIADLQGVKPYV